MSDPKYNTYAGELRFDDDNIVDVNLQPDTENITVRLNGAEITGGSELPEVDSEDNGKVLTVVSGEWAAATPATPPAELPAVSGSDNGDVLTVVEGAWAKAAPAGGGVSIRYATLTFDNTNPVLDKTFAEVKAWYDAGDIVKVVFSDTTPSNINKVFDLSFTNTAEGEVTVFYFNLTYSPKNILNSGDSSIINEMVILWSAGVAYQIDQVLEAATT